MPAYATLPYRNATKLANHLLAMIVKSADERGVALLAREWLSIEFAKREWRGLPRLSAHSMREILDYKRAAMKNISSTAPRFEEIHDDKESLSPSTVPAPPTPEAPAPCSVGNDK
jgi:hypothetical protein